MTHHQSVERRRRLAKVKEWLVELRQYDVCEFAMKEFGCQRRTAREYIRHILHTEPNLKRRYPLPLPLNLQTRHAEHRELILKIVKENPGLTTQQIIQKEWLDLWTTFATGPRLRELRNDRLVLSVREYGDMGCLIWYPRG